MHPDLQRFMAVPHDGVFYIGHASALVRMNGKLILLDPVWNHKPYGDFWEFRPEQIDCEEILHRVDACIVSHIHEDHLCDRILRRLRCPVTIMGGRKPLSDRLIRAGAAVRARDPGAFHDLGVDGVEVQFVPHPFNSVDSSCFLRNTRNQFTVYHGNDNFLDRDQVVALSERFCHRVHVAMIPYAFIHWYPWRVSSLKNSEKIAEARRCADKSLTQARMFIDAIQPQVVIPFGASLSYVDPADEINALASPFDLVENPLITGGFVQRDSYGKLHVHGAMQSRADYETMLAFENMGAIERRVAAAKANPMLRHDIVVNEFVIRPDTLECGHRLPFAGRPFTHFRVQPMVYRQWARGEITFEQALGTRCFTVRRKPEEYNLAVLEFVNNYL